MRDEGREKKEGRRKIDQKEGEREGKGREGREERRLNRWSKRGNESLHLKGN